MSVYIRDVDHPNKILISLPVTKDKSCDVTFYCQNRRVVKAHRLVLGAGSPFLKTIFQEQALRDTIEVSLPDINSGDLDIALSFIYEGLIRLEKKRVARFCEILEVLGFNIPSDKKNIEARKQNLKRKPDTNVQEVPKKILKTSNENGQEVINNFTNIMKTSSSKTKENDRDMMDTITSKPDQKKPLLVPMKHLRAVLSILEEKKAEKRLEDLVQHAVQQQLKKIKESFKKAKLHPKQKVQSGNEENQQVLPTVKPASQTSIASPNQKRLAQPPSPLASQTNLPAASQNCQPVSLLLAGCSSAPPICLPLVRMQTEIEKAPNTFAKPHGWTDL